MNHGMNCVCVRVCVCARAVSHPSNQLSIFGPARSRYAADTIAAAGRQALTPERCLASARGVGGARRWAAAEGAGAGSGGFESAHAVDVCDLPQITVVVEC